MDRPICSTITITFGTSYQIGEWLNVIDPVTGKPASRNLFYGSKHSREELSGPIDPDNEDSVYQDRSMQALTRKLTQSAEEVVEVEDMLSNIEPGILVVGGMAAALALLRAEGHDIYITA